MLLLQSSSSGNLDEIECLRISPKLNAMSCPQTIRTHLGLESTGKAVIALPVGYQANFFRASSLPPSIGRIFSWPL
jgi:hypothetical protein